MKHIKNNRKDNKSGKRHFSAFDKVKQCDMLAQPVPTFNIKGEETIKTNLGAFCSILIAILVLSYAILKF